jgi:hypothetical protein
VREIGVVDGRPIDVGPARVRVDEEQQREETLLVPLGAKQRKRIVER